MANNVLAIIPARAGSKRILNKNIRAFLGKPLIAYTIEQAKNVPWIDRIVVDTDSPKIASVAQRYGADVPFLRPKHLATDTAQIVDSILHLLARLKKDEGYEPSHIVLLQTTSPLRELQDIDACRDLMRKTGATTVLTVCPSHPRLYHLKKNGDIVLANLALVRSTNVQVWKPGYILNGCFVYIVKTDVLKREKSIITKKTKAVVCPKWRSVDVDMPEDWVLAEFLYKNKKMIEKNLRRMK